MDAKELPPPDSRSALEKNYHPLFHFLYHPFFLTNIDNDFSFLCGHQRWSIFLVGNSKHFPRGFDHGPLFNELASLATILRRKFCKEFLGSSIFTVGNPKLFPGASPPEPSSLLGSLRSPKSLLRKSLLPDVPITKLNTGIKDFGVTFSILRVIWDSDLVYIF